MKKFMKNAALVLLTGGLFFTTAVGFTACSKTPDVPKDDDKQHEQVVPKPDDGKDDPTKPPIVDDGKDDKKALEEGKQRLYGFLQNAVQTRNFHYAETQDDLTVDYYCQYFENGFNIKVSDANSEIYYARTENEDVYKIYKDEKGNWVGEPTNEELTLARPFMLLEEDYVWTKYNENTLFGNKGEEDVTVHFAETSLTWDMGYETYGLNEIGKVSLQIPEFTDLTKPTEEYVYQTVNGQREYNIPVLAKTLEETLKADSSILTKATAGLKSEIIKVTHVKMNDDGLIFGAYYKRENSNLFGLYKISETKFIKEKLTVESFGELLSSESILKNYGGATTCATSTLENDDEFNIMAQNVLTKLAQDGVQGNSINNKVQGIPEFANAKILFGYKTKNSNANFAFDMGLQTYCNYCLIIDNKLKVEELNMRVSVACSAVNDDYYLTNLDTNQVLIVNMEREEIDKDNTKLYENNAKISTNSPVALFYEEKRH